MEAYMLFKWNGTNIWIYCNNDREGLLKLNKLVKNHQLTLDEYEVYKSNGYTDKIECIGFDIGFMFGKKSELVPGVTMSNMTVALT